MTFAAYARRLFKCAFGPVTADDLMTIRPQDILASRVVCAGLDTDRPAG